METSGAARKLFCVRVPWEAWPRSKPAQKTSPRVFFFLSCPKKANRRERLIAEGVKIEPGVMLVSHERISLSEAH